MVWNWLRHKGVSEAEGVASLHECAETLRRLTADRRDFFTRTRNALRQSLSAGAATEAGEDLLDALCSWLEYLSSRISVAFPAGTREGREANRILLENEPARPCRSASHILAVFASALKSLDLAVAPEIANASRTLKEAADDFIQLCAGVIVPADEMLAQSPEPEWSGGEGLYCSREEPCWQTIARRCLLADGFPVTFPVAVIVDEVEAGKVIDFVVEVFPGPGPTLIGPHPVEFDHANHEFHAAAAEAWRAALSASMPPHVAAWSRGLKAGNGKMPLTGESAGGAFSLALRRALRAKDYPGAVVVLAAVKGAVLLPLGPPEDDRVNKSIRLKVNAILQNPRIDTIATVREHGPYIRSLLAGQDRVRVVEITPGWGSSLA